MFGEIGEKRRLANFILVAILGHLLFIINYDACVQTLPHPPYFTMAI